MTNQSPALKRNFGRRDWRRSENEEAVQSDEAARQSNSWQASVEVSKLTHCCLSHLTGNAFNFTFNPLHFSNLLLSVMEMCLITSSNWLCTDRLCEDSLS